LKGPEGRGKLAGKGRTLEKLERRFANGINSPSGEAYLFPGPMGKRRGIWRT